MEQKKVEGTSRYKIQTMSTGKEKTWNTTCEINREVAPR